VILRASFPTASAGNNVDLAIYLQSFQAIATFTYAPAP
jgi:hypothetical protein